MAATGELVLMPMFSPVQVEAPGHYADRQRQTQRSAQPRVYRLPPKVKTPRFAYSSSGYTSLQQDKGRRIDLYA